MHQKYLFGIILSAFLLFGTVNAALAIPCDSGDVSGSTSCQDGIGSNDFPAPDTVNAQNFFGFNDWLYLSKFDADTGALEQPIDVDWDVQPDDSWADDSGTWSFNPVVWDFFDDIMIVVKSGNNDLTYFSGYLLDNTIQPTFGTWATGDKDVSHLTLYGRGAAPVPEPATVLLFGLGVTGFALVARKKKG